MKITWDDLESRTYKTGLDHGVLYPFSYGSYNGGVAWNGLTEVNADGGERSPTALYTGRRKSKLLDKLEEFSGSILAYMYPDEFERCIGMSEDVPGLLFGQQEYEPFGLCYRTFLGNAVEFESYGYELHLIYNAVVKSTSDTSKTKSESSEIDPFQFDFDTVPYLLDSRFPISHVVVKSNRFSTDSMNVLEDILFGNEYNEPRLPTPEELISLFAQEDRADIQPEEVIYHGLCSSPTEDLVKEVTCDNFELSEGVIIAVKFESDCRDIRQLYVIPTTDEPKYIEIGFTVTDSETTVDLKVPEDGTVMFTYNGTNYVYLSQDDEIIDGLDLSDDGPPLIG